MDSLKAETVTKIADLARLELESSEIADYAVDLNNILGLVEEMQAIDTKGIAVMSHPVATEQHLREDLVDQAVDRDELMANAPQQDSGLFLVPKVVE